MTKEETRTKVLEAFKELRKQGFLARANFCCCQSDAGYDLTTQAVEKVNQGKEVKGGVYWHNQDEDNYKMNGEWYLAYGHLDSTGYGIIGLPNEEIGKIVVNKLKNHGVEVEWDGDPGERILIKSNKR